MGEEEFPLSLKREWKAPDLTFEFLWINSFGLARQLDACFRINRNLELVAVGDELMEEGSAYRLVTLVFKEVKDPKPARRAFSLKKEWELTKDGFQTLDTVKEKKK